MKIKITLTVCAAILIIILAIALGSVYIHPIDIFAVIMHKAVGITLPGYIQPAAVPIVWNLRLPRVLLAFVAGGALSVAGAVMQSVLRNPLASSYTLGVSSGASLGASLVIFYAFSLPFLSAAFTLPVLGFVFGLGVIILAVALASRLDGRMENHTIILTGMVFSLFVNAVTTLMSALSREQVQRLVFWQMGSFSMKDWSAVYILSPVAVIGVALVFFLRTELDVLTFGEEQAQTMGVPIKKIKWLLLITAAALTGATIAFAGVIGFVDLVAPHISRRLFGSAHRYCVPMSAVLGGGFMVLCDLAARTVIAPSELPVGAVTAIIGAPFFTYIYFSKRKRKRKWVKKP